jgi:ribosomal protein S18 acetylase RimI-like enzyme
MTLPSHFKRYWMERRLVPRPPAVPPPAGFWLVPWADYLLDLHADVLFASFADDLDGKLFPNLADRHGCRFLMRAVRNLRGFCPSACWLMAGPGGYVGAIQGVIVGGWGAVQNLGVTPEARGRGVGAALLARCLGGFATAGAKAAELEVTATNTPAVRLYKRFEFRPTRLTYKPAPAVTAGV